MMRVLHCIWRMSVGGAEGQLVRVAAGLVRRGVEVDVATVFPGALDADLVAAGANLHRLYVAGKYDPLVLFRLASLCRRVRPDVMQTHLTQMDIVGGAVAEILRIPWILSERSMAMAYPPTVVHRLRSAIGARADLIVANSVGGGEYWRSIARDPRRVRLIPNVVPQTEIDAAPHFTSGEEGFCATDEVVLYVGRFSAEKNLETLLNAISQVVKSRKSVFVFCGDGSMRAQIEAKALELGIADRTRFLGTVINVWSWMKRADAMVAVSLFEGDPNAVLEAIAAGTPLVVSNIPAHRALLNDQSAWFVDPSSASSVAAGLVAALSDRTEARERAARARSVVASRSADEIAARYEEVYQELMARRQRPGGTA
jgi:glycosyltransferase involved in cell wall biosynthesis